MYVCLCKGITDSQIRQAIESGANSIKDLRRSLGVATQCGKCSCFTKEMLKSYQAQLDSISEPLWAVA